MTGLQYDVVVVGAGPAGSATAREIARSGYSVLVAEEHSQIGEPLHCSGLVTPRTLEEAGVGDDLVLNRIAGALILTSSGGRLNIGGRGKVRALVIDRVEFDRRLAQSAEKAGACLLLGHRVASCRYDGEGVEVVLESRSGERLLVHSRLLIGADGFRSVVAQFIGRPYGETIWALGGMARVNHYVPDRVQVLLGCNVAPGWFGWTIPLGNGLIRFGVGTPFHRDNGANPKPRHLLDCLVESFPEQLDGLQVVSYSGGFIPLYRRVKTYARNTLLVGDAALQVKATSGGGIYAGLVAARHAAASAMEALDAGDFGDEMLSSYEKRWRKELGPELDRGLDIRRLFLSLDDKRLNTLLRLMAFPPLTHLINRYGDIDYPSPMFAALFQAQPLFRTVLRLPHIVPGRWASLLPGRRR